MKRQSYIWLTMAVLAVLLTACGNKMPGTDTAKPDSPKKEVAQKAILTVKDMAGRNVTFDTPPKRIVALTNGDLSIIYALGGTVIGRQTQDASGVHPKKAAKAQEVGNTHDINLERIAATNSDVVVASAEQNQKDVPALEGIGTKVILTGANSLQDIDKQISVLGALIAKRPEAKKLQAMLDKKVEAVKKEQAGKHVKALMVLGAPGSNYAALPSSLSGNILEVAGGENVAKNLRGVENFPQYAALNVEKIIAADPEIIFLMIHGGDAKDTEKAFRKQLKENKAWKQTKAVKNDHIVVLPADLFGTNPGIRVIEALDLMKNEINKVGK